MVAALWYRIDMRAAAKERQRGVAAEHADDQIGAGVPFRSQALGAGFGLDDVECRRIRPIGDAVEFARSGFVSVGVAQMPEPLVRRDQALHVAPPGAVRRQWPAGQHHLQDVQQLLADFKIALIAGVMKRD
jgi:hypothetical protein